MKRTRCTYPQSEANPEPCECGKHRKHVEVCPKCIEDILPLCGNKEKDGWREKCPLCGFVLDGFDPGLHDYDDECNIIYYVNDDGTLDDRSLAVIIEEEERLQRKAKGSPGRKVCAR